MARARGLVLRVWGVCARAGRWLLGRRAWLRRLRDRPPLTRDELADFTDADRCRHCGGYHLRFCPKVKRMNFAANGALVEVEFWPSYDESAIIWPEQVEEWRAYYE